jgi:hypothetical protein
MREYARPWSRLLAVAFVGVAVPAAATALAHDEYGQEKEQGTPTSIDAVPNPAHDALLRAAHGARILDIVEKAEQGERVYMAHVQEPNDVIELDVDESGRILGRRVEPGYQVPQ